MKTKSTFHFLVVLLISSIMMLLYGCKKDDEITPQNNQTGEVIVLEDNSLNNIISYSSNTGTIVFSSVTSEVSSLSKNDILVAGISDNTPFGFLRKVTSVSDDKKTVQTQQATLEEAIEEGGLYFEKQLKPNKNFKMDLEKGVRLLESTKDFDFGFELNNFVIYDHDENLSTTNDQILANGSIHFNYAIVDTLYINKFKLVYFEFMNIVTKSSEIEITANFVSNNIDKEKALGAPYQFKTFLAGTIMGVPVYVTPYLEVFIGANGNVSICTSKVSRLTTLSGGVKYSNKEWHLINDYSNTFSFDNDPTLNSNLEIKTFAGPRVTLMIYDVAGPYGQIDGYFKLKANNKTIYWYLYGGLDVKVGVKVEALSRTWVDKNWILLEYEKELANGIINDGGNSEYYASYSTSTPVINGQVNISEWTNANSYNITYTRNDGGDTKSATLYIQHDNTWLYVGVKTTIDAGWDVYHQLRFDGNNDHSLSGNSSEPHTDVQIEHASPGAWGGYNNYQYINGTSTPAITPPFGTLWDSYSSTNVNYEYKLKLSDLNTSTGQTIGFFMLNGTDGTSQHGYEFPINGIRDNPSEWAHLILNSQ